MLRKQGLSDPPDGDPIDPEDRWDRLIEYPDLRGTLVVIAIVAAVFGWSIFDAYGGPPQSVLQEKRRPVAFDRVDSRGLSDSPDPTDALSQEEERIIREDGGAIIMPPEVVFPDGGGVIRLPPQSLKDAPAVLGACDSETDCDRQIGSDCETYGYGGAHSSVQSTENLTEQTCSGQCRDGCNVNGCPTVIRDCSGTDEPPEGDGDIEL